MHRVQIPGGWFRIVIHPYSFEAMVSGIDVPIDKREGLKNARAVLPIDNVLATPESRLNYFFEFENEEDAILWRLTESE